MLQGSHQQRQHVFGHVIGSGQAEPALTAGRVESGGLAQGLEFFEHLAQGLDQGFGVLAEHITTALAHQQGVVEGFAQVGQLAAQGRLADTQAVGGVAEVLQLQEAVEGAQVGEAEGGEGGVHAVALLLVLPAHSLASPLPLGPHNAKACDIPVGAGLPANGPQSGPSF